MSLDIPPGSQEFIFSYENLPESTPVVFVSVTQKSYTSIQDLMSVVPDLLNRPPVYLARMVNHLFYAYEFDLITDPTAYEKRTQESISQEDPNAPFDPYTPRITDFGVPDFSSIHAPQMGEDGTLTYFTEDKHTHLPYCVSLKSLLDTPQYIPCPLTPISRPTPLSQEKTLVPDKDGYIMDANDVKYLEFDLMVHEPSGYVHEPRYLYVGKQEKPLISDGNNMYSSKIATFIPPEEENTYIPNEENR